MKIDIPKEVSEKMEEGERVVGHMTTLFNDTLFFTKMGCETKGGCRNFIYRSDEDYKKENVMDLVESDLEKHELRFISAFLWN